MKKGLLLLALFSCSCFYAQQNDSLAGFDEAEAIRNSVREGFSGSELRVRLAGLQRKYIHQKFKLNPPPVYVGSRPAPAMACTNEDFETSSAGPITNSLQINGWEITRGSSQNYWGYDNCNLIGCCQSSPVESSLVASPGGIVDPVIGSIYPIFSVFGSTPGAGGAAAMNPQINFSMGGSKVIRLNSSDGSDYSVERLSKSFTVTANNTLFSYAFITVTSPLHDCCGGGALQFIFTDVTTNSVLSAYSFLLPSNSPYCPSLGVLNYLHVGSGAVYTNTLQGTTIFHKWKVIYADLSPYLGDVINVTVIAGDCGFGVHSCYAYFDSQCSTVDILLNNQVTNLSCVQPATVSANTIYNSYQWTGPNNFTSSASSFTTNASGTYTLVVPQAAPFPPIQKTINIIVSPPSLLVNATPSVVCNGQLVTLSASGLNSYSWSNGSTSSSFTVLPVSNISYTVTGNNSEGCSSTAIQKIVIQNCDDVAENSGVSNFNLYPSPNAGEFTIEYEVKHQAQLLIVNELGQVLLQKVLNENEYILKISLPPALYYYQIMESGKNTMHGKFVVCTSE